MNQLSKMQQCSLIGVVHDPNTDGYFNPEVVKYRQLCAKSQQRRQLYSLQQYYHRLLKQILVSRKVRNAKNVGSTTIPGGRSGSQHLFSFQELLDFAVHNGLDFPPKRKVQTKSHAEIREQKVRRRLRRILKEVKTECGDSNASSEDDGQYFSCFLTILFFFFLHAFLLQEFTNRFRTKGSFDWGLELKVPK